MQPYNPKEIEPKWQQEWQESGLYKAEDGGAKPKWYSLVEFPYPSGAGLHTGHIRSYTGLDILSRKRRMQGYNVLYPMGWDAFGLPTENYAIKTGRPPQKVTKENISTFRRQLQSLGYSFDWSREINTTDPNYYKWTQWLFIQFFKAGLAYKAQTPINWCLSCKIGLANEEVVAGVCERCGGEVERRNKAQWMLKITAYADKLLQGLEEVDFLPEIKTSQKNWIGRSEGAEIDFITTGCDTAIKIFTTRPDTIYGATYIVLAPEHPMIKKLLPKLKNQKEVKDYIKKTITKSEQERKNDEKEKTGVELKGIQAINPANDKKIPIFIADYVLTGYGTGAIMAVPAHDERDKKFATKFNLPINDEPLASWSDVLKKTKGKKAVKYKIRDWVFSRQRYWGEPIPLINCQECGWVAVPESKLPVILPELNAYQPRDDGQSPLASLDSWVNTTCPTCKAAAKRETDVMPNWAGSSWYFLRYTDPNNNKHFASEDKLKYWTPVDWYNGGMEHVTLHLLYSRFWNLFLFDKGLIPTKEPYKKRTAHGMILATDGKKMSKSLGNVIGPDSLIEEFGADALRLYEMFMGPFDQAIVWDERGILGPERFLKKVWDISSRERFFRDEKTEDSVLRKLHQSIKKVTEDIEKMSFNTAISTMMEFTNMAHSKITLADWLLFIRLLAPFAPHITEEIWANLGGKNSIHTQSWPNFDSELLEVNTFELVVQINGKVRTTITSKKGISQAQAEAESKANPIVKKWLSGKPKNVVFVPNRLINFIL